MKKVRCILAFIAIFVVGVFFGEKILASISLFDNTKVDTVTNEKVISLEEEVALLESVREEINTVAEINQLKMQELQKSVSFPDIIIQTKEIQSPINIILEIPVFLFDPEGNAGINILDVDKNVVWRWWAMPVAQTGDSLGLPVYDRPPFEMILSSSNEAIFDVNMGNFSCSWYEDSDGYCWFIEVYQTVWHEKSPYRSYMIPVTFK